MVVDKYGTELKIGDCVLFPPRIPCLPEEHFKTIILDVINLNEENKHNTKILCGGVGVPVPKTHCNVRTSDWKDFPKVIANLDKCFILQHSLAWVFPQFDLIKTTDPNVSDMLNSQLII